MIIDTERLDNFIKAHKCQIDSKAKKFEDALIYVNYKTGKWESVLDQLKTDIEFEEKWDELEDVLFVENDNGDLVLCNDWDKYKAGTLREDIWVDMFDKYSGGAELAEHPIYKDRDNNNPTFQIPDIIKDLFLNSRIIIEINNELEYQVFLENFKDNLDFSSISYFSENKYYFIDEFFNKRLARYSSIWDYTPDLYDKVTVAFEDIYKISQIEKIPDAIMDDFINKKTAIEINNEPEYQMMVLSLMHYDKFEAEDEFYQSTYFSYDSKRPLYYISSFNNIKACRNIEHLIECEGINQLVGFKDFDKYTEASKIPDIIKDMFLDRQLVIKVDNEKDAETLFKELKTAKNCKARCPFFYTHENTDEYDPKYPYYFMDKNEYLNSNVNMENIVRQEGIRQLVAFEDFDDIQKVTEPERNNNIDLEER